MNLKNLSKIIDATHYERVKTLEEKFGDDPKHYLSQLSRVKGDKLIERVKAWYDFVEGRLPNVQAALEQTYPEILEHYQSPLRKQAAEQEKKERNERRRLAAEEKKKQQEASLEEARREGKSFINYEYKPGHPMTTPDRFFSNLSKINGVVVVREQGDVRPGADYERRNGLIYSIANKYTVEYKGKTVSFNVLNLTNEGAHQGSFGWVLDHNPRMTWKEVKDIIKTQLKGTLNIDL